MGGAAVRQEMPRGRSRASWAFDVGVAAVVALFGVPFLLVNHAVPFAVALPVVAASVALMLVRRGWPVPVFATGYALTSSVAWFWPETAWSPMMLIALYTVVTRCARPVGVVCAVALAGACVVWSTRQYPGDRGWPAVALLLIAILVATTLSGLYIQTRRRLLMELEQRAVRLERERDQQFELAAAGERSRIAREMHDIVAHHLTVMVALSDGAAAQAAATPQRAQQVMRIVSATGRQALADTRRLLGVLRDPDAASVRSPLPGLADVAELIDGVRAAGLPVSLHVDGRPPVLDPGTQLAVFRLVQEALTNTLKHAGDAANAVVRLRYADGELAIEVVDDGCGVSPTDRPRAGAAAESMQEPVQELPGRGLPGMRERMAAVGGQVVSGPGAERGWAVRARVPVAPR